MRLPLSVSREDIQSQGFSSVADILQNTSAATGSPPFSRASPLTSNQEAGGQSIDLRNLGAERTLVLVNGKRLGISPSGYQDLSRTRVGQWGNWRLGYWPLPVPALQPEVLSKASPQRPRKGPLSCGVH